MQSSKRHLLSGAAALAVITVAGVAQAAPTIRIPAGARFASGQKFDIRVESATLPKLFIDGKAVAVTPASDAGGYYIRAYSNTVAGTHTLTAVDASGSSFAQFLIINQFGSQRPVRNIIILLGDGMGTSHRTAARIVRYGVTNGHVNGHLAMDDLPALGLVNTHSLNSIVTDSAPGMASYVTGNKSFNSQEGVFPDNTANASPDGTATGAFDNPRVEYLSEYLHRVNGKSLGIVSTADIEDATPAANAVHTANRNAGTGVCDQFLDESRRTGLTVLLGGGRRWFLPAGQMGSSRSATTDYVAPADLAAKYGLGAATPGMNVGKIDPERDLIHDFQAQGFKYTWDRTSLLSTAPSATKLLGLFAYGNMNVSYDKIAKRRGVMPPGHNSYIVDDYGAPNQPMLDEMTDSALTVLNKNPNGFVLMVEGAHIDKQSHLMDSDRAIWEVIEFDHAVKKAVDFAKRVGNTTVIVTADHECGGFSIIGGLSGGIANLKSTPSDVANTDPSVVPARQNLVGTYDAAGFPNYAILNSDPSSDRDTVFNGFPATADIDGKVLIGYGASADRYEGLLSKPLPVIDSLLPADLSAYLASQGYPAEGVAKARQGVDPDPYGDSRGYFIRGQVPGPQAVHTATDIPLTAYSSGSNADKQFNGEQDNTDVFFKLMKAVGGGY